MREGVAVSLWSCRDCPVKVFNQFRENNTLQQGAADLICGGQEHFTVWCDTDQGKQGSVSVSASSKGVVLFAILYQELQDYCAQGAVKSLPTPQATETTGVLLPYHRNTHWSASILNNKETKKYK